MKIVKTIAVLRKNHTFDTSGFFLQAWKSKFALYSLFLQSWHSFLFYFNLLFLCKCSLFNHFCHYPYLRTIFSCKRQTLIKLSLYFWGNLVFSLPEIIYVIKYCNLLDTAFTMQFFSAYLDYVIAFFTPEWYNRKRMLKIYIKTKKYKKNVIKHILLCVRNLFPEQIISIRLIKEKIACNIY